MHTYPAWKIWLVAIVLLVALLLALPNVFGEAPALRPEAGAQRREERPNLLHRERTRVLRLGRLVLVAQDVHRVRVGQAGQVERRIPLRRPAD